MHQNPRYSMRAFAKNLNLAPSFISDILNGRKNLSIQSAFKISEGLKLTIKETTYFQLLVRLEAAKTQEEKLKITRELEPIFNKKKTTDLSLDCFRIIADWHHTAILEMTNLTDFEVTASSVSKYLKVNKLEAQTALDRLERLELIYLDPQNKYQKSQPSLLVQSLNPNEGLRHFHKQMLLKAIDSLSMQNNKEKFIGSETFAFDEKSLAEVSEVFEECFTKVVQIAKRSKKKKHVYHLGIQFFKVT
ncbi:MAG: TIGR02147 family protein [Bdellovibrionales bacterium]